MTVWTNGDRIKEYTSSTGTGDFVTTGAVTGFATLSSVLTANGDSAFYCAFNSTQWETGTLERVNSTTYQRVSLAASSSGGTVNFTTAPTLMLTIPARYFTPMWAPVLGQYRITDQTGVSNSTWTKVQFNSGIGSFASEGWDGTNYRFLPTFRGYWHFDWGVVCAGTSLSYGLSALYKNGSAIAYGSTIKPTNTSEPTVGSKIVYLNGTSDYVEVFGYVTASSGNKFSSGEANTFLTAHMVGWG